MFDTVDTLYDCIRISTGAEERPTCPLAACEPCCWCSNRTRMGCIECAARAEWLQAGAPSWSDIHFHSPLALTLLPLPGSACPGVLSTLKVNPDKMLAGLSADMLATDLAEYLVRKGGWVGGWVHEHAVGFVLRGFRVHAVRAAHRHPTASWAGGSWRSKP